MTSISRPIVFLMVTIQAPERGMAALCQRWGIALLCYGTVGGGLLSERWLGVPEPRPPFENRSLTKYKLIVDEFGGWEPFQRLLETLQEIGRKHGTGIAAVAGRYVLQKDGVAAIIVGARHARHLPETLRIFGLALDEQDLAAIAHVARGRGPAGDIYSVERQKGGKHAAIMRYNLNQK